MVGAVERLIARLAAAEDLSGTVLVAKGNERVAEAFGGVADPAAGIAPGPATRFGTASVTKMFTAAAIARLAERNAFDFHARVGELLPRAWYPRALDRAATVHHLLTHTSGMPEYVPEAGDATTPDLWSALGNPGIRDAAGFLPILAALPPGSPPTTLARYCNSGYIVLGLVIEAVTGHTFSEVIATEVMEPAGMVDSAFLPLDRPHPDTAVGMLPGGGTNAGLLPVAGSPDGGAFCTSRDLVRFLVALHHGDLLQPDTRHALMTPWTHDAEGIFGYGYGQLLVERGGRRWCGHSGEDSGVSARAYHSPSDGVSLVMLSNRTAGVGALWRRIADALPTWD